MAPVERLLYNQPTYKLSVPGYNWVNAGSGNAVTATGIFENMSTNNHWFSERKRANGRDIGSNWTAIKTGFSNDTPIFVDYQTRKGGVWYGYRGPLIVHDSNHFLGQDFLDLDDGASSEIDLMGLGSTAISRVIPTNPIADMPTALAELYREGIPGVMSRGKFSEGPDSIGNPADGYLGYEFGLRPFFNELQAFGDATRNAESIINQYAKNSGKLIRRRYDFPVAYDTNESVISLTHPDDPGYLGGLADSTCKDFLRPSFGGTQGVRTDVTTRTKKSWFSGAFTYYLPEVGTSLSDQLFSEYAEMRRLYGGISLSTAWNLLPYSWAADWMTNAGDVLRNVEAFAQDGLVMAWGYIMESCDFHVTRRVEGGRLSSSYLTDPYFTIPATVQSTFTKKYQRRRQATPYGFGLDVDGFTPRQKAIITSLGISRLF